jgi:methionine-rich copper-binding protein CopC
MNCLCKRIVNLALLNCVLFFSVPYSLAHARPKVMVPAANSVVASPALISITFSEAVEPRFSSLNVIDEHDKKLNTAPSMPLTNDAKTLTLALPPLVPGGYLVKWVSVATDGHRMEGEYKFTVK